MYQAIEPMEHDGWETTIIYIPYLMSEYDYKGSTFRYLKM